MSSFFFGLPPELMTALATVLGFALLGDLDPDQQNALGNFLMLIAQLLETNAAQQQLLEDKKQARQQQAQQAALEQRLQRIEAALAGLQMDQSSSKPASSSSEASA